MIRSVASSSQSASVTSGSQTSSRTSIASMDAFPRPRRHVLQATNPSSPDSYSDETFSFSRFSRDFLSPYRNVDEGSKSLWGSGGNLNRRDRLSLGFRENTIEQAEAYVRDDIKCVLCEEGRSHYQCVTEDIRNRREEGDLRAGLGDPCLDCFDGHPHDFCM